MINMKSKNEVVSCLGAPLCICDSTLRGGEQAAGVVFSNIEKYRIAQLLDDAGVPQIEAGIPMLGVDEKKSVRHIARMGLKASIVGWNRAEISDINNSIECDVDAVTISMTSSDIQMANNLKKDRQWVLDKIYESISYASEHGLYIICAAEDAARADLGFLIDFAKVAKEAGADRLRYCDSVGRENPFDCHDRIKMLKQIVNMDIEIQARNDFGLASANCMAGVRGGARFACTSVLGLGERAGEAPLEEVAMISKHMLALDTGIDVSKIRTVAECVSAASGRPIPTSKPMLGTSCFSQESGIYADGVKGVDDPYDPSEVGMERNIVIGKHSVRNTVIAEMSKMGIEVSREDADTLLTMVRRASVMNHRSVTPRELFLLYQDMMSGNDIFDDGDEPAQIAEPVPAQTPGQ